MTEKWPRTKTRRNLSVHVSHFQTKGRRVSRALAKCLSPLRTVTRVKDTIPTIPPPSPPPPVLFFFSQAGERKEGESLSAWRKCRHGVSVKSLLLTRAFLNARSFRTADLNINTPAEFRSHCDAQLTPHRTKLPFQSRRDPRSTADIESAHNSKWVHHCLLLIFFYLNVLNNELLLSLLLLFLFSF